MRPVKRRSAYVVFLFFYVGSYWVLSAFGEYSSARATSAFALIRVDWAPVGFVIPNRGWNYIIHGVYLPLYALDRAFWHRDTLHATMAGPLRQANGLR